MQQRISTYRVLVVLGLLLAAVSLLVLGGCETAEERLGRTEHRARLRGRVATAPSPAAPGPSIAYKLAVIDGGAPTGEDDLSVARFRSLLGQLDRLYVEESPRIADMTVKAQELLRQHGVDERLLTLMEAMNRLFPEPFGNQSYAEYVAVYVSLRIKGHSHAATLAILQQTLAALGAP